jgi:nitroreductase
MEVFEAVRTILATLSFSPKSVPKESVRKILKAARLTGRSVNLQP